MNSVQEKIDGFRAQGFTEEIMEKLGPMVERGGEKLLKQVENGEKYNQVMKDFFYLKKSKTCLMREVQILKNERKKAQGSVVSFKNQAEELRLRAAPSKTILKKRKTQTRASMEKTHLLKTLERRLSRVLTCAP